MQQRRGILDDDEVMEGSDDDEDDDGNGDDGGGEKKHKGSLVAAMAAAAAEPAPACGGPPPTRTVSFAAAPGEQDGNAERGQSQGRQWLSFEQNNESDHAKLGAPRSAASLLFFHRSQERSFEHQRSLLERRGGSIERQRSSLERKSSIERRGSIERRRGCFKKVIRLPQTHLLLPSHEFTDIDFFLSIRPLNPAAIPGCLGRR